VAKLVCLFVFVPVAWLVVGCQGTDQSSLGPPNPRVHDGTFGSIDPGTPESRLDQLLGEPHKMTGGKIVNVAMPESPNLQSLIEPVRGQPGVDTLYVYQGRDNESIQVLVNAKTGRVSAVQYCIGDRPVVYKGGMGAETRPLYSGSTRRIVSLDPQQDEQVRSYRRAQEIQSRALAQQPSTRAIPLPAEASAAASEPARSASAAPVITGTRVSRPKEVAASNPPPPPPAATEPSPPAPAAESSGSMSADAGGGSASGPGASAPPPTPDPLAAQPPAQAPQRPGVLVELPSGEFLTESMLELRPDWQQQMYPQGVTVYVGKNPDQTVKGVFAMYQGKLDGTAVTFHDGGTLAAMAVYRAGSLEGALRLWDETHRRILYSDYVNNGKDGLTCLFREGEPWLVQRCRKGAVGEEYLIKLTGQARSARPIKELKGADADEGEKARAQLAGLENQVFANEGRLKRDLAEWYKAETERAAKAQVAALRQKQRDGQRQRSFERQSTMQFEGEQFWRSLLGRSW